MGIVKAGLRNAGQLVPVCLLTGHERIPTSPSPSRSFPLTFSAMLTTVSRIGICVGGEVMGGWTGRQGDVRVTETRWIAARMRGSSAV